MQSLSIRFLIGLSAPDDADTYTNPDDPRIADKRERVALSILSAAYPCLGSWRGVGYWQGKAEPSLTVETVVGIEQVGPTRSELDAARDVALARAQSLARDVARALGQEAVGLVIVPVRFTLEGQHATL